MKIANSRLFFSTSLVDCREFIKAAMEMSTPQSQTPKKLNLSKLSVVPKQ